MYANYKVGLTIRKRNFDVLTVGTLVVIQEDNLTAFQWQVGCVMELHPGTDGITRVLSVRTASGCVLKPSVIKVCVLLIY